MYDAHSLGYILIFFLAFTKTINVTINHQWNMLFLFIQQTNLIIVNNSMEAIDKLKSKDDIKCHDCELEESTSLEYYQMLL